MKNSPVFLACLSTALASCATEPDVSGTEVSSESDAHAAHHMELSEEQAAKKMAIVKVLVERFDVPECLSADVIATMKRSEADGPETFLRAYQVPVSCSDTLKASFPALGFSETEAGLFTSEAEDGTAERVLIRVADDGAAAGIEWETIEP